MNKNLRLLTEFLNSYLEWVESGAKKYEVFRDDQGLCYNLERYYRSKGIGYDLIVDIAEVMRHNFEKDGLCSVYPFNEGDEYLYDCESARDEVHLNPYRITWVRKFLKENS